MLANGKPVRDAKTWMQTRRPEIVKLFEENEYGRVPGKPAGMSFDDVVAVQVYLTDMDLFPRMNAVYGGVFKAPRPARTTVGVTKLAAPKARIEITVTARK